MNRTRYSIIFGSILLLLGLLWGIRHQLYKVIEPNKLLSPQRVNSVQSIEFSQGEHQLKLIRDSSGWKVEPPGYKADSQKINTWLKRITLTSVEMPITKNQKQFLGFGLNPDNKEPQTVDSHLQHLILKEKGGHSLLDVFLGNQRPSLKSDEPKQYLQFSQKKQIYLISQMIPFQLDSSYWFDPLLLSVDPALIKTIELIRFPEAAFNLDRNTSESAWNINPVSKGQRLKTNAMEALSRSLNAFPFESVLPVDSMTAPHLSSKFTVELFDGRKITIQLGKIVIETKTLYLAALKMELLDMPEAKSQTKMVEEFNQKVQPWFFVLETWTAESFLPTYDSLLKSNTY